MQDSNGTSENQEEEIDTMKLFLGRIKGYAETVNDEILIELLEELEEVYKIKINTK